MLSHSPRSGVADTMPVGMGSLHFIGDDGPEWAGQIGGNEIQRGLGELGSPT